MEIEKMEKVEELLTSLENSGELLSFAKVFDTLNSTARKAKKVSYNFTRFVEVHVCSTEEPTKDSLRLAILIKLT
ncbi:hypothetical protein COB55_04955 [Candidatus Wolfebacteria bacterium]|nr:MAG: hypothetical protein COB55_04955 [Candidatus Wolfebacteria bacterium]